MSEIRHPAKYSSEIVEILRDQLRDFDGLALDPFAGVGKIREIEGEIRARLVLGELESEWARMGRASYIGDALKLPFQRETFDLVFTSPVYGNRMSDHHNARDGSRRNTYRHSLGRALDPRNSGSLQWGEEYRAFHLAAWKEIRRVLRRGGWFILNISDHVRKGEIVPVSAWHVQAIRDLGFMLEREIRVKTARNRFGENGEKRVDFESVFLFTKYFY